MLKPNASNKELSLALGRTLPAKLTSSILAPCEITGISIKVEIPFIEGFALIYTNPLAYFQNFQPIASLPALTLVKYEKSILAGILLAAMKQRELLQIDNEVSLTSVEQNILLQSLSPTKLVDFLKFFILIDKKKSLLLPRLALADKADTELQKSSLLNLMDSYVRTCKDILFPIYSPKEDEIEKLTNRAEQIILGKLSSKNLAIQRAVNEAKKTKALLQSESLTRGRKIIKELSTSSNLSDKLLGFCKILFQGETLLTTESSVKERIATALQKHAGDALALELSRIVMNPVMSSEADSIFPTEETREEQEENEGELKEVEAEQSVLSLKERIALIKAKKAGVTI